MKRPPTLFWRTFGLIVLLIVASVLAWVQSWRVLEREPRAHQIAQQMISIVNITRAALLFSDAGLRHDLLRELADNEGVRIVPREPDDELTDLPDSELTRLVDAKLRAALGPQTRLAASVNGAPGSWVSFGIDGDDYWVYIERDPQARDFGTQWVSWAVAAALLSLLAAAAITRVVNRPLARLSQAARELGAGHRPATLPEAGPAEILTVNQSFNRMVADLDKLEQDRALLLAGVSHDLRTPLTRLRLEIEINALPAEAHAAMSADIEQIDATLSQFLDYARGEPQRPAEEVDLSALAAEVAARQRRDGELDTAIAPGLRVRGQRAELARALDNLLGNAARYGRGADGRLRLRLALRVEDGQAVIEVADQGPGIAAADVERLLRPFERGDSARGGSGAGLGLAIVARIARMHGGRFDLLQNAPQGLCARLRLPLAPAAAR